MYKTRSFRCGNSQAVLIPAELAYSPTRIELEIERVGEEIRIRPVRRSLAGILDKFASFSSDFSVDGRGDQEQTDREPLQ